MLLQLWAWARSIVGELRSCKVCQDKKKKILNVEPYEIVNI